MNLPWVIDWMAVVGGFGIGIGHATLGHVDWTPPVGLLTGALPGSPNRCLNV